MPDLIDREKVLATLSRMVELPNEVRVQAMAAVSRAKAVDAVPVVRCKDCKHYVPNTSSCDGGTQAVWYADDFCSYGERRTDNVE